MAVPSSLSPLVAPFVAGHTSRVSTDSFGFSSFAAPTSLFLGSSSIPSLHVSSPSIFPLQGFGLSSSPTFMAPNVTNVVTTQLAKVEDYLSWRTQFEAFLISNNLLYVVDGSFSPPAQYIYEGHASPIINPDYATWLRLDQTVRSWLFVTLHRDVMVEVHDLKHSVEIWARLQMISEC